MNQLDAVREENARLRKALEFYADEQRYYNGVRVAAFCPFCDQDSIPTIIDDDSGAVAREALGLTRVHES